MERGKEAIDGSYYQLEKTDELMMGWDACVRFCRHSTKSVGAAGLTNGATASIMIHRGCLEGHGFTGTRSCDMHELGQNT